jgi:hypothetical protein
MVSEITEFLKNIQRKKFRPFFVLGDRKRKALGLLMLFLKKKISLNEFFLDATACNKKTARNKFEKTKIN